MGDDLKYTLHNLNNPTAVSLFLYLFFFSDNGTIITGRRQLARALGTSERKIRTALTLLVNDQLIDHQTTHLNSTIHILERGENNTNTNHQTTHQTTHLPPYIDNINNISSNNINILKEKKNIIKRKESEKVSLAKLQALSPQQLWKIAWDEDVPLSEVRQVHKEVLLSVEDGNKYKIKDVGLATRRWIVRKIGLKQIVQNDEFERIVLKDEEPAERERIVKRFKEAQERFRARKQEKQN